MPKEDNQWLKLDNAAKIYPAFAHKYDPATFRVAAVLKRDVILECLERALQETIDDFPAMALTLRRGLFWAYLDEHHKPPIVLEEEKLPCTYINLNKSNGYLFHVYYYKKRISLECFHALTDGYGALEFLKALLYNYFKQFMDVSPGNLRLSGKSQEHLSDGYKAFSNKSKVKIHPTTAKHIKGTHIHMEGVFVHHGILSASGLKAFAKSKNTTITVLLTAIYLKSLLNIRKKGPMVVAVPINLRKIFPTASLRNFSYVMNIVGKKEYSLEEMILSVHQQFQYQTQPEILQAQFSQNVSFEEQFFLRVMPNIFKSFILKQARTFKSKRIVSSILTNPGIVQLPEDLGDHVTLFETVLYASTPHSINMGISTFKDNLVISLSRCIEEKDIILDFYQSLKAITQLDLKEYSNEGD